MKEVYIHERTFNFPHEMPWDKEQAAMRAWEAVHAAGFSKNRKGRWIGPL